MVRFEQGARSEWIAHLACAALFFVCFLQPESVYRNPAEMAEYFGAPHPERVRAWDGSWSWTAAPFKYRVLFHGAVDGVADLLPGVIPDRLHAYWVALMAVSAASFSFALLALSKLLESLRIPREWRAYGLWLWFLLPPVHQAYSLPTQTKEDFLAYGLFFLGLRAILERRFAQLLVLSFLCALTRETLLLLPALYLVAATEQPWLRRGAPLALALSTHFAVRWHMGPSGYDALKLDENLASPPILVASLLFALGVGWVGLGRQMRPALRSAWSAVRAAFTIRGGESPTSNVQAQFFALLPFVLLAIVPAHLVLGRIQEIRISALLAPWAVAGLLAVGRFESPARLRRASALGRTVSLVVAAIAAFELSGLGRAMRQAYALNVPDFASRGWWLELYLQLLLAAVIVAETRAARRLAMPDPRPTAPQKAAVAG